MINVKYLFVAVFLNSFALMAEESTLAILRNHSLEIGTALSTCHDRNRFVNPCNFDGKDELIRLLRRPFTSLKQVEVDSVLYLFGQNIYPNIIYSLYGTFVVPPTEKIIYPYIRTCITGDDVKKANWAQAVLIANTDLSRIHEYKISAEEIRNSKLSAVNKRDLALHLNISDLIGDTSGMQLYQKVWIGDTSAIRIFKELLHSCKVENKEREFLRLYVNAWKLNDFKTVLQEFNKPLYEVSTAGKFRRESSTFQSEILFGLRRYHPEDSLFDSRMGYFNLKIGEYSNFESSWRYISNVAAFVKIKYGITFDTVSMRRFATAEFPKYGG